MDSRILDASGFYAGIPFASSEKFLTTSLVFEEIKHIKKNQDALGILLETKRLEIIEPEKKYVDLIKKQAKITGDFQKLSEEDISFLALGLQLKNELVTDDFSVSNVAKNLGLKVIPVMTTGIKNIGNWTYYCPGCHKKFTGISDCPICGNKLRRKLQGN